MNEKTKSGWKRIVEDIEKNKIKDDSIYDNLESYYKTACSRVKAITQIRKYFERKDIPFYLKNNYLKECKILSKKNKMKKNQSVTHVNADKLVEFAYNILSSVNSVRKYDLIIALLICTGRRTTEITNGRSKFLKGRHPRMCKFIGQLKTSIKKPYFIPLLLDFRLVQQGVKALRALQTTDTKRMSNAAISRKYQSGLRRHIKSKPIFAAINRIHDFRGIYAMVCYKSFRYTNKKPSMAYAVMCVLGDSDLDDSTVYTTFDIQHSRIDVGTWDEYDYSL